MFDTVAGYKFSQTHESYTVVQHLTTVVLGCHVLRIYSSNDNRGGSTSYCASQIPDYWELTVLV